MDTRIRLASLVALIAVASCQAPAVISTGPRPQSGGIQYKLGGEACIVDIRPPSHVSVQHFPVNTADRTLSFVVEGAKKFSLYSPDGEVLATGGTKANLKFSFVQADGVKCDLYTKYPTYPSIGVLGANLEPYVYPHTVPRKDYEEVVEFTLYGVTTYFLVVATP